MVSEPLISVLMPIKEVTRFTRPAIESVLTQSHHNIELIIVGLRGVARDTPGIIGALNTGLKNCTGDFIARMDSDDLCHIDRLKIQLEFAKQQPLLALIGGRVDIFDDQAPIGAGNQSYESWLNTLTTNEAIRSSCFIESPLPHPTWFAHKSFWHTIGGYRDMGWPEDYDLILRTWLAGIPMAKPNNVVLRWREHPTRLTRTDNRYSRQAFIKAKAWALVQPEAGFNLAAGRSVWICGTGRNARYWHDALSSHNVNVKGFVELDNAKAKTQKRHLPIITYEQLLAEPKEDFIISAINSPSARQALQSWFSENQFYANQDYILGG